MSDEKTPDSGTPREIWAHRNNILGQVWGTGTRYQSGGTRYIRADFTDEDIERAASTFIGKWAGNSKLSGTEAMRAALQALLNPGADDE